MKKLTAACTNLYRLTGNYKRGSHWYNGWGFCFLPMSKWSFLFCIATLDDSFCLYQVIGKVCIFIKSKFRSNLFCYNLTTTLILYFVLHRHLVWSYIIDNNLYSLLTFKTGLTNYCFCSTQFKIKIEIYGRSSQQAMNFIWFCNTVIRISGIVTVFVTNYKNR